MEDLKKKLQPFIPGNPEIEMVDEEYSCQIVNILTKEVYGTIELSEDGKFEGYHAEIDYEEEESVVDISVPAQVKEMLRLAQLFVETFVDREVHFSVLCEFAENNYMISYEERDPKLGLFIPNTGCSLYFTRDAALRSASIGQTDIVLEYPSLQITKDEAKEILQASGYLQLSINLPGHGEDRFGEAELIYRAKDEIVGVTVDGKLDSILEFMGTKEPPVHDLTEVHPSETMEEMLNVQNHLVRKAGEDQSVIWVDPAVSINEEEEEAVISIYNGETGHFSYSNLPFEQNEELSELSRENMQERAVEYLELVVGNVHEKYVLEDPDDFSSEQDFLKNIEETSDGEEIEVVVHDQGEEWEDYPEAEPTVMFRFYRVHQEMRLLGYDAHVHIGVYSGIIRECSITFLTNKQIESLKQLSTVPSFSMKVAEQRFFNELEMTLVRAVKSLDDPKTYTLSYLVEFPETGGHIEKMNAHTGVVSYVDTGIIKESE